MCNGPLMLVVICFVDRALRGIVVGRRDRGGNCFCWRIPKMQKAQRSTNRCSQTDVSSCFRPFRKLGIGPFLVPRTAGDSQILMHGVYANFQGTGKTVDCCLSSDRFRRLHPLGIFVPNICRNNRFGPFRRSMAVIPSKRKSLASTFPKGR